MCVTTISESLETKEVNIVKELEQATKTHNIESERRLFKKKRESQRVITERGTKEG